MDHLIRTGAGEVLGNRAPNFYYRFRLRDQNINSLRETLASLMEEKEGSAGIRSDATVQATDHFRASSGAGLIFRTVLDLDLLVEAACGDFVQAVRRHDYRRRGIRCETCASARYRRCVSRV